MSNLNIIIRNFGPIEDVNIELSRLNILIGNNCTGKSTIVKCLAALFNSQIIFRLVLDSIFNENKQTTYREIIDFSLKSYNMLNYKKNDGSSFIEIRDDDFTVTHCNQCSLALKIENQELKQKTDNIKEEIKKIVESLGDKSIDKAKEEEFYRFISNLVFGNNIIHNDLDNILYIPAERDILLSVMENPIEFFKNYEPSQYLIDYAKLYNEARKYYKEKETPVFNYKYTFDDNRKTGMLTDAINNVSFSLNEASSGLKSLLPIILLLEYIKEKKENEIIIIEEPEISLFPEKQDLFARYLAEYLNQNPNVRIVITTHSPYLLFSFTNLAYAKTIYQKVKNKEEVKKIIPEQYMLNPDDICAYLLSDGKAESLINKTEDFYINDEILISTSDKNAYIHNQLYEISQNS